MNSTDLVSPPFPLFDNSIFSISPLFFFLIPPSKVNSSLFIFNFLAGSPCPLFYLVQHMVTLEQFMFHFLSNKGQYTVWCMILDPVPLIINAYGAHDMMSNIFTIFVTTLPSPLPNLGNYYTKTKIS